MLIGIDDTDSLKGMCTTYLAALLCRNFKDSLVGFPRLIRLNPNIPFKTRGNGAIAIRVKVEKSKSEIEEIKELVLKTVEKYSQLKDENTNPGVVFLEDESKVNLLREFYFKALSQLVSLAEAEKLAGKVNAEVHKFKNGRGVIGALAAIGSDLSKDKTYEILAYRKVENFGKPRKIDENSVIEMDLKTRPLTFNNIDPESKRILITPHGYDPVLFGIRGENPEILEKAAKLIKTKEEIALSQIFESNQATDVHLRKKKIAEVNGYDCVILEGIVAEKPRNLKGGHVIFKLKDETSSIECAAYEPTKSFRDFVRKLREGDKLRVYGGVGKYEHTVNLEKFEILKLNKIYHRLAPICCNKRMTSAGKGKGFKCKKCGKRLPESAAIVKEVSRDLKEIIYEVPLAAMRHLSKPISRFKHELRKKILAKRESLPKEIVAKKSEIIAKKLLAREELKKTKVIFIYASFKNEVQTLKLIEKLLNSGKKVLVPKIRFPKREMIAVAINSLAELKTNKIGIPEPSSEKEFPAEKIELAVIPGIVFDKRRYRIGYGYGYYDAFLSKAKNAKKIALAFDFQVLERIPAQPWDVQMDLIITDHETIL
ncbi:MAG TPA: 5-formyltetrahydrofolate cyclo-ligase [Candidatus Altiarchaeales archaeon]|nr:5-formyltetrahydrofolate cyclo-ligase [Candidatus Altiarchaeales archaeon]